VKSKHTNPSKRKRRETSQQGNLQVLKEREERKKWKNWRQVDQKKNEREREKTTNTTCKLDTMDNSPPQPSPEDYNEKHGETLLTFVANLYKKR